MVPQRRNGEVFINEVDCKRTLRLLGISTPQEWKRWCFANSSKRVNLNLPISPIVSYANKYFWKEYTASYPRKWKEYQLIRRLMFDADRKDLEPKFARYAARYRAANGYRGIRFSGLSEATVCGYSAGMGVFLAYSALEACCLATGRPISKVSVMDLLLAKEIRRVLNRVNGLIISEITNNKLKWNFSNFVNENSYDIIPLAASIRHLFAHGVFTPWGLGVASLKAASVFDKLSSALLSHSDYLFSQYCLSMKKRLLAETS